MDAEQLTRLRAQRFAFLRAVYDGCEGDTLKRIRMQDVAHSLGLDEQTGLRIAQYLIDESLLAWAAMGGLVKLTHYGIVEVEEAIAAPESPTEHFPALVIAENYLHVASMSGSAIQQGTTGSTQVVAGEAPLDDVRSLLQEVRAALDGLELVPEVRDEAAADLATAVTQLDSPKPKVGIIRESLKSLRTIIEGAAGAGAYAASPDLVSLAERLAHAIAQLG